MTRNVNILLQCLNLVLAGIVYFTDEIPSRYKVAATITQFIIAGIISIIASNYNPDGTPAVKPYTPPLPKKGYIAPRDLQ